MEVVVVPTKNQEALVLWYVDPLTNLRSGELVNDVVVEVARCTLCGYRAQHLLSMSKSESPEEVYGWAEHPSDSDFELMDSVELGWHQDSGRKEVIGVDGILTLPSDLLERFMAEHVERIHPGRTIVMHYATQ